MHGQLVPSQVAHGAFHSEFHVMQLANLHLIQVRDVGLRILVGEFVAQHPTNGHHQDRLTCRLSLS